MTDTERLVEEAKTLYESALSGLYQCPECGLRPEVLTYLIQRAEAAQRCEALAHQWGETDHYYDEIHASELREALQGAAAEAE